MTNRIISAFLPRLPAIAVQLVLLHLSFKYVARTIVFPGSTKQWRQTLEDSYAEALLKELRRAILIVRAGSSDKAVSVLESVLRALKDQQESEGVHESQMSLLTALDGLLRPASQEALESHAARALELISADLAPKPSRSWLAYLFSSAPARLIGSLNYLRSELKTELAAEFVLVDDRLDCLLVRAAEKNEKIVLFCNPNAGYYETSLQQGDWLQLYTSQGFDFCSWNYRGFGRSQGSPSIHTVVADAENVVRKLISLGYTKFGVHGRSIGGVSAVAIASSFGKFNSTLQFVVADRTFSTLSATAEALLGRFAKYALWFAAEINGDLSPLWLSISPDVRKILIADKTDQMIADVASLRTGVALEIARRNFQALPDGPGVELTESSSAIGHFAKAKLVWKAAQFLRSDGPAGLSSHEHFPEALRRLNLIFPSLSAVEILIANSFTWGLTEQEKQGLRDAKESLQILLERSTGDSSPVDQARRQHLLTHGTMHEEISSIARFLSILINSVKSGERAQGQLLWVGCGHNGGLNDIEEARLVEMLLKS